MLEEQLFPEVGRKCKGCTKIMELLLVTSLLAAVTACDFPQFLQNKADTALEKFRYKDTQEGVINEFYSSHNVRVDGSTLKASVRMQEKATFKLKAFNWTCLEQKENGKFIVRENEKDFLCVSFIERSESVIQWKTSARVSSPSEVTCEESKLHLDPWPLLRSNYRSVSCPSIGGFWVDFYDNSDKFLCGRKEKQGTRIEFECTKNEGIYFNFNGCPEEKWLYTGSRSPIPETTVHCRAVWTDGSYTFVAASRESNNWIFRYKTRDATSNEFDVYLFKDAVADTQLVPDKTSNFLRAHVTRQNMNSLCLDYLPNVGCTEELCHYPVGATLCPKTCAKCHASREPGFCQFKNGLWGDWLSVKSDSVEHMVVNADWVNFTEYEDFRCLPRDSSAHTNMYKLFTNGCSPRYACMKTTKTALSVMEYELGRPLGWLHKQDSCKPEQFQYNQDPSSWEYFTHENINRILVNKDRTEATRCNLDHTIQSEINITSKISCDLWINPDDDGTRIRFRYTDCSDGVKRDDVTYTCLLADVRFDFRKHQAFWVGMKHGNADSSSCIIVQRRHHKNWLTIVPTGECLMHKDSFFNLRYIKQPNKALEWLSKWPEYRIHKIKDYVKPKANVSTGPGKDQTKDKQKEVTVVSGYNINYENNAISLTHSNVLLFFIIMIGHLSCFH